ncbi:hypothetical protein RHGRI_021541 [Rhododendron griersonianum]|uniref:Uncharacterized protein n=1 Tax=Rhododendron griersonianum TaxID=479676 RepID=A0AAV6JKK3_9ERIC|nr:hypothetical protein RHGRI_021541 [Rhododendron griersonianum]
MGHGFGPGGSARGVARLFQRMKTRSEATRRRVEQKLKRNGEMPSLVGISSVEEAMAGFAVCIGLKKAIAMQRRRRRVEEEHEKFCRMEKFAILNKGRF